MSIHLSLRLRAIANLVPAGAQVIDVGTDHAMLPVWLAQTGRATQVWASDIRPGPLDSARRLIFETNTGDRVHTRMTDGLSGFGPEDADTIIMAGMGGETMTNILAAARWTNNGTLLILEPQSKQTALRRWLLENGFSIFHEQLVKDNNRIYPILMTKAGKPEPHSETELLTGRLELISADPLFSEYLSVLIRRTRSAAPYDKQAEVLLTDLLRTKERLFP